MDVIPDGGELEFEPLGDLSVRQVVVEQTLDLLLAPSERRAGAARLVGQCPKDQSGEPPREIGLAPDGAPYCVHYLGEGSLMPHEPGRAGPGAGEGFILVLFLGR